MKNVVLGKTGISVPQNGFGALPIQRVNFEVAKEILLKAYNGGMKYFDTARAYSDSEEKIGYAFAGLDRSSYYIASKTGSTNPKEFFEHLETSLKNLRTDYIDVYQFHCANQVFKPNDGTGMYEAMLEAKKQGKIKHIGITAHKWKVALEAIESGLYETVQFPFSYLASDIELNLVNKCKEHNVGFIAMKGLAGGVINNSLAAMSYIYQYDNVLPIWGIQKISELDEWLSFFDKEPVMNDEVKALIEKDRQELKGDFCRACGYCMPCPEGIQINACARMKWMVRRAPTSAWTNDYWQKEMEKTKLCQHCGNCTSKCPYGLDTPQLLIDNYIDYQKILSGEIKL